MKAMNEAATLLLDHKDFECFSKSNTDVKTYVCDVRKAHWEERGDLWVFTITADRFLRNMVRAVVGTLLEVGLGKMAPEDIHSVIESKDRSEAGVSVPAKGLYLTKVLYPKELFDEQN
jgi:tRNA pseudouridine38-40 synthase